MGGNLGVRPGKREAIDTRRLLVAQLRNRQMSMPEIRKALEKAEIFRSDGKPYGLGTIRKDLKVHHEMLMDMTRDTLEARRARVLGEILETRKAAWAAHNLKIVLQILVEEAKLFGLYEPIKVDITEQVREIARAMGEDEDEAVQEALRIVNGNRLR